jgi:hypothetical protein
MIELLLPALNYGESPMHLAGLGWRVFETSRQ